MRVWLRKIICCRVYLLLILVVYSSVSVSAVETQTNSPFLIRSIYVSGNNTTRQPVILKELTFHQGDTLSREQMEVEKQQSINNLLNTSLFNYVYITFEPVSYDQMDVYIRVEERWYLWVAPLFEQTDRNMSSFIKNGNWDMVNYGLYVKYDNFRGRQEKIMLRIRVGYSTQFLLNYDSPEYRSKWGWGMWVDYNFYDQVAVSTTFDKPLYISTMGHELFRSLSNAVYVQYRSSLYLKHRLALKFNNYGAADTVVKVNPNFFPDGKTKLNSFDVEYRLAYDTRDSRYYPLKGGFRQLAYRQIGVGGLNNGTGYPSGEFRFSQYSTMLNRIYGGSEWVFNYTDVSNVPYFMKNGIGYKDFIRGYEYYVVDGRSYYYSKNKIGYQLLKPRVKDFNLPALNKFSKIHYAFYLNLFYDFAYVHNNSSKVGLNNQLQNNLLYGYGIGIDFVTFYDKAFSFNYAVNKFGTSGFFFHLNLNI